MVKTEQSLLRRNRRHLISNPKKMEETAKPLPVGNIQPTKETGSTRGVKTLCSFVKTRSGRTVIPPTRLDLETSTHFREPDLFQFIYLFNLTMTVDFL